MTDSFQKEFHLERSDRTYNNVGKPTMVTIRQATPKENELREAFLSKKSEEYITFLKEGYKYSPYRSQYEIMVFQHDYIDDVRNRIEWLKGRIKDEITSEEIYLTLAACNIQDYWNRHLIKFSNGYVDRATSGEMPSDYEDEIHEKVLELNPSWLGEFERICNILTATIPLAQKEGNFKDLTLESIFSKSKTYLGSLMEEINADVFDNKGSTKVDVSTLVLGGNKRQFLFALKQIIPPLKNLVLYYSPIPARDRNSYIGVLEHSKFEIRVIARRDKFNYWDTDIDGIIETLRTAIEWWKNKSTYSQYELDGIAEAADYDDMIQDGKAFWSDMEDYGYTDEDF